MKTLILLLVLVPGILNFQGGLALAAITRVTKAELSCRGSFEKEGRDLSSPVELKQNQLIWEEDFEAPKFIKFTQEASSGLRVAFWNIREGQMTALLEHASLDENLRTLVRSTVRPHVLILAEMTPGSLELATILELRGIYPFMRFEPYNQNNPNLGIMTLSNLPLKSNFSQSLDWVPHDWAPDVAAAYKKKFENDVNFKKFERRFIDYEFIYNGKPVHILPIHMLQNWSQILATSGKAALAKEIVMGGENPMVYQIDEFNRLLKERFGADVGSQPVIVIGDSNLPSLFSRGYWSLKKFFKDAFSFPTPTFPSYSAPENEVIPSVKIDQALVSQKIGGAKAQVLPIRGSDHYLIFLIVKNLL